MQNLSYSLEHILSNLNIEALNEMQEATIAAFEQHNNLVLFSATGSGKTLAFLLCVLNGLDKEARGTQALIIAPSRELALQIEKVFKQMGTGNKVTCCYGGHKREIEENNLIEPPVVIVGTPGRIADHIRRGNIKTEFIRSLVLDEFDKSLEMGFLDEMSEIINALPGVENRILTSATEAVAIPEFVGARDAERLHFLAGADKSERLAVKKVLSEDPDKIETLFKLLCNLGTRATLVFCNHRESVERVHDQLRQRGIYCEFYHGAMEQRDRDSAICKFRNGTASILVTTDLASRGLDIPNIRYVIHYHLPVTEDVYIHRNGRTARMEASGTVILLLSLKEELPAYIKDEVEEMTLREPFELPDRPQWTTLYLPHGKKDKVNKIDVVGFLAKKGGLKPEDIGLIEVKDFSTFVAVRRTKANHLLALVKEERIKGKKAKVEIAK